jgi:nitrilase
MSTPLVCLAAAQPLSMKQHRLRQLAVDAAARAAHFRQWNLGAASYDAAYCRRLGEGYLPYLAGCVARAARRGARLLLLPEFAFVPGVLAAPAPGAPANPRAHADAVELYGWAFARFTAWAAEQARRHRLYLAAATLAARGDRLHNTGLLVAPTGDLVGIYAKVHLPPDEAVHTTRGETYPVWQTELGRVGFAICYDIQYPEHTACLAAADAQLILHPSAGYTLPDESWDMGRQRLRVRASDHYCALLYSCTAPEHARDPREACVIAPQGDCLAVVRGRRPGLAIADVALGRPRAWPGDPPTAPDREAIRRAHRRPTTYHLLTQTPATP